MCQPLLLSLKIFHTRKFLKHRRVPLRTISVPWDKKNFDGKSWHRPLSSSQNFSIPESSWKTEGFLYEMLRHSERQKLFSRKFWNPLLLSKKLSVAEYFRNTERFFCEVLWYCENKKFRRKIMTTVSSFFLNIFWYQKSSWKTEGLVYQKIRYYETKTFSAENRDTTYLIYRYFFPIPQILWNAENFLFQLFRFCETKKFRRKIVTAALSLILNSFRYQKTLGRKRVPLRKVSVLSETKNHQQKNVPTPSFIIENFSYPKVSETQKSSSTNYFGTVRQEKFRRKIVTPPTLFFSKFFDTRKFLEDRRVPLRNVTTFWETEIIQQKILKPPSFIKKVIGGRIFPKHWTVRLRSVMVLWEQKVSTKNHDNRLLFFPQHFLIPKSSWKTEWLVYQKIRYYETKQFPRKIVIPPT